MARGTTSYYGRRYTIATPMTHLYMLCACIFCWIVGYVDSVGYPVYGEVTAPPLWNALCMVFPGKLFTYLIGFYTLFMLTYHFNKVAPVKNKHNGNTGYLKPHYNYLLFICN